MKPCHHLLFVLFCSLCLPNSVTGQSSPGSAVNDDCANNCKTPPVDDSGGDCEEDGTSESSIVLTPSYDYLHFSYDFVTRKPGMGCTPCETDHPAIPDEARLPEASVVRVHRSRHSGKIFPSFGHLTYWKGVDIQLDIKTDAKTVQFIEPSNNDGRIISYYKSERGGWVDTKGERFFVIQMFNANGQPINKFQMDQARSAVVTHHDGSTDHFEVFGVTNTQEPRRQGRLISSLDRNGNALEIFYEKAIPAGGNATMATRPEYFAKTKVRDAYGKEILVTNTIVGDKHYVSQLTLPNGEDIDYSYGGMWPYSWQSLRTVDYPDGTQSTFSVTNLKPEKLYRLNIFDASETGMKRHKEAFFSAATGFDANGNVVSQPERFIRSVVSAEDELIYANEVDPNNLSRRYAYEGGNRVKTFEVGTKGGITSLGFITDSENWNDDFYAIDLGAKSVAPEYAQAVDDRAYADSHTDPTGRSVAIARGPIAPQRLGTTYPDGTSTAIVRNAFQDPVSTTDRLGRVTTCTYDAAGNKMSETEASGTADAATRRWLYNTDGQVVEARDPLYDPATPDLHSTLYRYDPDGYLIEIELPADVTGGPRGIQQFTWTASGLIASTTDPLGRVTTYDYDERHRLVMTTYNDGSTEEQIWGTGDDANLIVSEIDRNGIETTYEHDLAGRVIETAYAAGLPEEVIETCEYLVGTELKSSCTKRGERITYDYDNQNRLVSTTRHATATTSLTTLTEFDNLDRRRSTTDAYGRRTFYLYDGNDRVTRTVKELVPDGLGAVPDFDEIALHLITPVAQITRDNRDGDTLTSDGHHDNDWQDPRDEFLADLTRDTRANPAWTITDVRYDAAGQRILLTDERSREDWSAFDAKGRLTDRYLGIGLPGEQRTETEYDDADNVVTQRYPRHFTEGIAAVQTWTWTGRNLQASHTEAEGDVALEVTESYTYYLDGRFETHTDFRGHTSTTYWHQCCGRLQGTIDRDNVSTTVVNTDFNGNVTHQVVYGDPGNTLAAPQPPANWHDPDDTATEQEITRRYDGLGRVTHAAVWLQPLGNVDDDARASLGTGDIPIPADQTEGLLTTFVYDDDLTDGTGLDNQFAAAFTELANRGITFSATDADGSAFAVTNAENETTLTVRDGLGRTVMVVDGEGDASTIHFDEMVAANVVDVGVDSAIPIRGDLLATTVRDGLDHPTVKYGDASGATLVSEDAEGNKWAAAFDASSNQMLSRDPNGVGEDCIYDPFHRKTQCTDTQEAIENTSRSYTWNAHNQLLTDTDAEGHTASRSYDARDRQTTDTDRNQLTTAYGYDANGNLVALTDPNNHTRTWTYSVRDLKIVKAMPDPDDEMAYAHDASGRVIVHGRQDGSVVHFDYDLAGRLVERGYSDVNTWDGYASGAPPVDFDTASGSFESSDTFVYDGASRLIEATKGRHAIITRRTYAEDGEMLSESYELDGRTYPLARTYDAAGRVLDQTFADGEVIEWTHNARDLVTEVRYDQQVILTQQFDDGARNTSQLFGNGLERLITYGRADNLRTHDHVEDGSVIDELDFTYTYAPDKNVLTETNLGGFLDDYSFTATHDPGNRVVSYSRSAGQVQTQSWNYDGAGNWNSTTINGSTQTRQHSDSDELSSVGGDSLTYDSRGNLTDDDFGDKALTWDLDNRLVEVESTNNAFTDITYRYDAIGRRIAREQNNNQSLLIWWGLEEQAEHHHRAGQETIQNDLLANPQDGALNTTFARALEGDSQDIQYFHKNYLDHVMAVSDDIGNVVEHYRYTAFGEVSYFDASGAALTLSAIGNNILWNVKRFEAQTEMYAYALRYYITSVGKWANRDPIHEAGGVNLSLFAANDPLNRWDAKGLDDCSSHSTNLNFSGGDFSDKWKKFTFGQTPSWSFDASFEKETCKVCCPDGKWGEEHTVNGDASGSLGIEIEIPLPPAAEVWVDLSVELQGSVSAGGSYTGSTCDGSMTGAFCITVSGSATLKLELDDWVPILEAGAFGKGDISCEKCYSEGAWGGWECEASVEAGVYVEVNDATVYEREW